jgi:hypothetical protein
MGRRHNQTLPQKLARSRLSTASRLRTHAQQSHSSALPQKLARSRLSTASRLRTHAQQSHSSAHRYALRDDPWSAGTTKHCRRNLHAAVYLRPTASRLRTHEHQSQHSSAHRYALRDDPWGAGGIKHCRRNLHAAGHLRHAGFAPTRTSHSTHLHTGMRSVTIHGAPAQSNAAAETCTQQVIYGMPASRPRAAVTL